MSMDRQIIAITYIFDSKLQCKIAESDWTQGINDRLANTDVCKDIACRTLLFAIEPVGLSFLSFYHIRSLFRSLELC